MALPVLAVAEEFQVLETGIKSLFYGACLIVLLTHKVTERQTGRSKRLIDYPKVTMSAKLVGQICALL